MESDGSLPIWFRVFLAFLLLVVLPAGIYVFARTRKVSDVVKDKPSRIKKISTLVPYKDAINRLIQYAPIEKYKVEDVTHDGSRVVLSTPVSLFSYGYFYPVYFSVEPGGTTLVEVGIASPVPHRGPSVSLHHDKCMNMVSKAVLPPIPPQSYDIQHNSS